MRLTGDPGKCSILSTRISRIGRPLRSITASTNLDAAGDLTPLRQECDTQGRVRVVADTANSCRLGDRVPVALRYGGNTPAHAQVGDGLCGTDDRSVVSFGSFREGILAATCTLSGERTGYNEVRVSDVNVNIKILTWTVNADSRSCSKRWDLEPVMTHE
jgi:hypothetical protein